MLLKDGNVKESYIIQNISLPDTLERRLEALGMTHQSKVSIISKKGRGIMIIKLRGSRFALGEHITENIEVQKAPAQDNE